jgi:hypothetical protein
LSQEVETFGFAASNYPAVDWFLTNTVAKTAERRLLLYINH